MARVDRGSGGRRRSLRYAVLAAAAMRGGAEPDPEVTWRPADDFWQHALLAAVLYIRAGAVEAGVPARQACRELAGRASDRPDDHLSGSHPGPRTCRWVQRVTGPTDRIDTCRLGAADLWADRAAGRAQIVQLRLARHACMRRLSSRGSASRSRWWWMRLPGSPGEGSAQGRRLICRLARLRNPEPDAAGRAGCRGAGWARTIRSPGFWRLSWPGRGRRCLAGPGPAAD